MAIGSCSGHVEIRKYLHDFNVAGLFPLHHGNSSSEDAGGGDCGSVNIGGVQQMMAAVYAFQKVQAKGLNIGKLR